MATKQDDEGCVMCRRCRMVVRIEACIAPTDEQGSSVYLCELCSQQLLSGLLKLKIVSSETVVFMVNNY